MRVCVSPTTAKQYPPSETTKARSLPLYGNVTDSTVGSMHLAELVVGTVASWKNLRMRLRHAVIKKKA